MNDPAAVVYDPVHGVYHQHWEDHLANPAFGNGYTRGHAVSRDLTFWARMPVSLWNDRPYDAYAIFTGSATVVNGSVVQVYPGLCHPDSSKACPGGTNFAIAVPEDPTDPLQTNWTKDGLVGSLTGFVNPIVNNTGRDPSTAWKTPSGEWRLTSYGSQVVGSMDFKQWYRVGQQKAFPAGECPSFFPLPKSTPGAGGAPAGAETPTHVYKVSHGGKDWMMVGTYVAGPPKQLGSFTATKGVPNTETLIDSGALYASKDMYDPVKQRRINWGWAKIAFGERSTNTWDSSAHTLAREVTWHPELQQLVYSPIEGTVHYSTIVQYHTPVHSLYYTLPSKNSSVCETVLPSGSSRRRLSSLASQCPLVCSVCPVTKATLWCPSHVLPQR
jgi:beta-fructofuranosidase